MTTSDKLDQLILQHLDHEGSSVDAGKLLHRLAEKQQFARRRQLLRWIGVGAMTTTAASVGLFTFLASPSGSTLSASEILHEVKQQYLATADHRYAINIDWNLQPFEQSFRLRPFFVSGTLWTRGDRFVVSTAHEEGPNWSWGQERDGRIWLAPTKSRALVYEPTEQGEPLSQLCLLMSLKWVQTIDELLNHFAISTTKLAENLIEVVAVRRVPTNLPNRPWELRYGRIQIDLKQKMVHRAEFHRYLKGTKIGSFRFQYQLSEAKADEFYDLRSHVDQEAVILAPPGHRPLSVPFPRPLPWPLEMRARFRDQLLSRFRPKID